MIELDIMGGMGNQMFQYAFARALKEEYGDEIVLNPFFADYINMITHKDAIKTVDSLIHFKLHDNINVLSEAKGKAAALSGFIDYSIRSLTAPLTSETFMKCSAKGKYIQSAKDAMLFFPHSPANAKHKKVIGYFQSEQYFSDIADILRDDFQIKNPPSSQNAEMIEELSSCNSVCVHIRRGDYLLPQNAFLNICNESYYRRGMTYIAEHARNPVFYIFSNTSKDLKWIEENYRFDYPVKYVHLDNPDYEELRLMYSCKHFIICNSSFSWWASYLSKNKDKLVIAPEIWTNNLQNDQSIDIYRNDMIKLSIQKEEETK